MRKYMSLKLQHKTYVDDTTKTYERDLQIKNCAFYSIIQNRNNCSVFVYATLRSSHII